jgi:hypothetical protein
MKIEQWLCSAHMQLETAPYYSKAEAPNISAICTAMLTHRQAEIFIFCLKGL